MPTFSGPRYLGIVRHLDKSSPILLYLWFT